ncbi:MAG: ribonuclease P protein component [Parcubacteria group bacterium]|nr:ribonuclease P protein component [Parcubacteria group bacterium]
MLPQKHRLKLDKDIKTLYAKGRSVFGMYVGVKLMKNNLEVSRFAVAAGLKVSKKAVDRNRIKRQVRAIVHEHLSEIATGYDVLLIVRKEALEKKTAELEVELMKTFRKAKLIV